MTEAKSISLLRAKIDKLEQEIKVLEERIEVLERRFGIGNRRLLGEQSTRETKHDEQAHPRTSH